MHLVHARNTLTFQNVVLVMRWIAIHVTNDCIRHRCKVPLTIQGTSCDSTRTRALLSIAMLTVYVGVQVLASVVLVVVCEVDDVTSGHPLYSHNGNWGLWGGAGVCEHLGRAGLSAVGRSWSRSRSRRWSRRVGRSWRWHGSGLELL